MSNTKRKLEDRFNSLETEVKKLKKENEEIKKELCIVHSKKLLELKEEDFMSYRFRISGFMYNLLEYINGFKKLKKKIEKKRNFLIFYCLKLVKEVYRRHQFSNNKEYNNFIIIANFLIKCYKEKKQYYNLWDLNSKLYKIYNLLGDEELKFDCMYNCVYFCYQLDYIEKSKILITDFKNKVKLDKVCIDSIEKLQTLKNIVYNIK